MIPEFIYNDFELNPYNNNDKWNEMKIVYYSLSIIVSYYYINLQTDSYMYVIFILIVLL